LSVVLYFRFMSVTLGPNTAVYKHAIKAAENVFTFTDKLPLEQRFVLNNQLKRSIILICNRLYAVTTSETKQLLKRNIEMFIKVYAETKTQIKMSQNLGHFNNSELVNLEQCLDQILLSCKCDLQ